MTPAAHKHLAKRDPVMRRLIREHGKCDLTPETRQPPFQSLVQAVAHQQLNGTAANTILTRFKKLFPKRKFPRPEDLASVTDRQIRACGFSFAKIASIRDIAAKTLAGVVRVAGGRFWRAQRFSHRLQKAGPANGEGVAGVRRTLASASHDRRLVSLVCGRRGTQKEVTSGLTWVITFLWAKSPKFLKNEAFVVIGKAARRGHRENPA